MRTPKRHCKKCGHTIFKRDKLNNNYYCKKCNTKYGDDGKWKIYGGLWH